MERQLAQLPYKPVEVTPTYEVFNLVLQVVVTVEATVAPLSPHWIGGFEKPFLSDLEEDLGPGRVDWGIGEPRAVTYWLALCSISGTVIEGRSTSDQKRRVGLIPTINGWMTKDGCASGMTLISSVKRVRYGSRGSSSFCLIPRRDAVVGFGRALARKLASNSLTSWSKEWMKASSSWLYHPRATPHRVIGKAQHIMASDVSYKAICTLNVTTCSVGSEPPSYASSAERRKCYGMDKSWISWMKGEPQRVLSPCSSFIRMVFLGSLNKHQYCPGVREGGFPSPNKGSGGGGCEAPLEVDYISSAVVRTTGERVAYDFCLAAVRSLMIPQDLMKIARRPMTLRNGLLPSLRHVIRGCQESHRLSS
ncbi:hypothetical protein BHE74_00030245 [Ensete ventricosum]|nr:hypothetical protein BHE74_00030245 [Ensete ventricosum]